MWRAILLREPNRFIKSMGGIWIGRGGVWVWIIENRPGNRP